MRLHNERRAFIANGKEKRGDPGPQPSAANMMELVGDHEKSELEGKALLRKAKTGNDSHTSGLKFKSFVHQFNFTTESIKLN